MQTFFEEHIRNLRQSYSRIVLELVLIFILLVMGGFIYAHNTNESQQDDVFVEDDSAIVKAVEKANPAVISIVATKDVPVITRNDAYFFDPYNNFEYKVPEYQEERTEKREIGGGSGFIVSPDGYAVTNRHVVNEDGALLTAFSNDGSEYKVKVVEIDTEYDIAVIKLEGRLNFPYVTFGDSDSLKLGQTVIAIGNALGELNNTISVGVVSGLSRSILAADENESEYLEEVIQTDAAINPGNSGGPLVGLDGKVLGVNVAMAWGSENIGFSLPASKVKERVDLIIAKNKNP